jgi:hypothetical protein
MLTRAGLAAFNNYNNLAAAVERGEVSITDVRKAYSGLRSIANRQVKAIAKSDVGFSRGEMNYFRSVRNLVTTRDLLHEVADLIRFYNSSRYSIKDRRATRDKTIATLNKRGIDVTKETWKEWIDFITWFKASAYSALYDSDSSVVQEVFEEGSNAQEWERLFKEWNMNH